jgi:hypothetical protein
MRLNLADVEVRDFEALPAGKYIVKITDYENKETRGGPEAKLPAGTPMINFEFTVVSNVQGETDKLENRKLWTNIIIHPKVLFNLKGLLQGIGWSDEQLAGDIDFEPDELVGAEMIVRVARREYPPNSGEFTNDIKGFATLDSASNSTGGGGSLLP